MEDQRIEGFRLSPQQRRVWRLQQPRRPFCAQGVVRIEGSLDRERLRHALERLIARHEILRTRYHRLPGMELPIQVVHDRSDLELRERTVGDRDELERVTASERRPFEWMEEAPVRFLLVRAARRPARLLITLSALAGDLQALENLVDELALLYDGRDAPVPADELVQYADFADWQNELLEDEEEESVRRKGHWDALPYVRLDLSGLRAAPEPTREARDAEELVPDVVRLALPQHEVDNLRRCAEREGVDLSTVLLTGWQLLVQRLSGETSPILGHLASGRRIEELEDAVGLFGRYLPLRPALQPDLELGEALRTVAAAVEEGAARQELFTWEEWGAPDGDGPAERSFLQVLFDFHESRPERTAGGLSIRLEEHRVSIDRFELRLSAAASTEGVALKLAFDPALWSRDDARRLLDRLRALLVHAAEAERTPVGHLALLGDAEARSIEEWNRTGVAMPFRGPIHRLFEEQVRRAPDDEAVIAGGEALSYGRLDRRANRLARALLRRGLGPEGRVMIALERSADQIVALLGILKAGGVAVPLDLVQPERRLAAMVRDLAGAGRGSAVTIVRGPSAVHRLAETEGVPVIDLGAPDGGLADEGDGSLDVEVDPDRLAYAIFTSGSTGVPKAVAVEHRSVVNLWGALKREVFASFGGNGPLRVALNAPLTFDASVKQWIQLLSGGTLLVVPEEIRADGERLRAWIAESRVSVLDLTPSQLRLLVDAGFLEAPASERPAAVLVGGEAIDRVLWERLAPVPGTAFFNLYGPTECTVDVTVQPVREDVAPSIGRPLANVRTHVVDRDLQRLPLGVPGELCVAGAGLARGYLNRPGATAESFVPDPFSEEPGSRLYRTADRARLRSDGRLEYLGRQDHQIKLRGVRMELGEIESVLVAHAGVRSAVVDLRDGGQGGGNLAAYIVPKTGARGDRPEEGLRHTLPDGRTVAVLDRSETEYMYREIFEDRSYLVDGLELDPGAVVFDVGANIGLFSMFAAQESPGARIYAFEPIRPIYDALHRNAGLHFPGAHLFPFGLSFEEATVPFTYYPRFSARSGMETYADRENDLEVTRLYVERLRREGDEGLDAIGGEIDALLAEKLSPVREEGRVRRLSDVIGEQEVGTIDLLKIDVQRAELDVLRGIDEEDWSRIRQIAMEVHDEPGTPTEGRLEAIRTLLRDHGFRVSMFQEETLEGTDRHFLVARSAGEETERSAPRSGADERVSRMRLPNGLEVAHWNRNETEFIYGQIFEQGVYLEHGIELGDGAVVFDVGANIGLFSLFVHQQLRDAEIHAFEPVPALQEILRENLDRYGVSARLDRRGLSDHTGPAELVFYPGWSAASGLYADEEDDEEAARLFLVNREDELASHAAEIVRDRFRGEKVSGELTTISEVIRERGIERIDLLKLDVEKSELDILRGIAEEDWPKIRQVVVEVHDLEGRLRRIRELLREWGFNVVVEQDPLAEGTGIYTLYATHRSLREMEAATAETAVRKGIDLREAALRAYLQERLPELMIPAAFVVLDELPYNRSGKVDRQALPDPAEVRSADDGEVEEPGTPVEEILAGLFGEVLGRERVGVDQSFFELGGHSLLATQLMSRAREKLSVDLPLRVLFEAPTVESLARAAEEAMGEEPGDEAPPLEPLPREGALPLSFSQQGLWFLQQMAPASASYNSLKALRLRGRLDPALVAAVLTEVVRRHEILRTRFPAVDGLPVQAIEPPAPVEPPVMDLGALPPERRSEEALALARREAARPFELQHETPLRLALLRLGPEEHVLLFGLHHIAADGWSLGILDREVNALFRAFAQGEPSPLPELPVQYADYAAWQRRWLRGERLERELDFWRRRLAGAPPILDLSTDRKSDGTGPRRGMRSSLLPDDLPPRLARLARDQGSTLYLVLLTAFFAFLHRTTDRDDLVVGTAMAGRDHPRTESLIGLFINMLPMRSQSTDDPTLEELLGRVRASGLEAYVHQGLPFDRLVDELGYERRPGRNPVFQVAFGVNNAPFEALDLPGLSVESLEVEHQEPRLDLTVWVAELPEGVQVRWTYDRSMFSGREVERFHERYTRALRLLVDEPEARVRDLELLGEDELRERDERRRERESANLGRLRRARRSTIGVSR